MTVYDWLKVRAIIERCVWGSGYVPTRDESRLLFIALDSDHDRYVSLHAELKAEAVAKINCTGGEV